MRRRKYSDRTRKAAILYCDIEASSGRKRLSQRMRDGYFTWFRPIEQEMALKVVNGEVINVDWADDEYIEHMWAEAAQLLREGWTPED